MNQIAKRILENTALCAVLALTVLMLVGTGAALAQVTAVEAYANDGARQNAQGGWTIPYDECKLDVSELGALDETACLAAGWNWEPQNLTGSSCYYSRPECLARIFYGFPVTPGSAGRQHRSALHRRRTEIGRASCRERVTKYV